MARGNVRCKAPAPAEIDIETATVVKKVPQRTATNNMNKTNNMSPSTAAKLATGKSPSLSARKTPSPRSVMGKYPAVARPGKPRVHSMTKASKVSKAPATTRTPTALRVSKASKISKVAKPAQVSKVSKTSKVSLVSRVYPGRTCLSRVCNREGIVWAKLCGFPHWPARIISESEREEEASFTVADKSKRPADDTLVYFFGTRNVAWVASDKALRAWKSGMRKQFEKKVNRDKKEFRKALTEVRKYCRDKCKHLVC